MVLAPIAGAVQNPVESESDILAEAAQNWHLIGERCREFGRIRIRLCCG